MFLEIARRRIGPGEPLFVIAELGLNHAGSVDHALALVDAAATAGASAVKLQTFRADELVASGCPAPAHVRETSLRDFFRRFELDKNAHRAVAERARARGLAFMATPFSLASVGLLEDVGVDALKIASGDLTYTPLIQRCARTGLPIVISTGLSTLAEIKHAVSAARAAGGRFIALLHCVSAYPVPDASQNLRAIETLRRECGLPIGLSDHGSNTFAVPIAVALGASLYERHLMLAGDEGVDAAVSSSPGQLAGAVAAAQRTLVALGHGRKECLPAEAANLIPSRRALHASRALVAGQVVKGDDVAALRPAIGLSPELEHELIGSVLDRNIDEGGSFFGRDLSSDRRCRGVA